MPGWPQLHGRIELYLLRGPANWCQKWMHLAICRTFWPRFKWLRQGQHPRAKAWWVVEQGWQQQSLLTGLWRTGPKSSFQKRGKDRPLCPPCRFTQPTSGHLYIQFGTWCLILMLIWQHSLCLPCTNTCHLPRNTNHLVLKIAEDKNLFLASKLASIKALS